MRKLIPILILIASLLLLNGCGSSKYKFNTIEFLCEAAYSACEQLTDTVTVTVPGPTQMIYQTECIPMGAPPTVYFDTNSDELTDDAVEILYQFTSVLDNCPDFELDIFGHCDERGSDTYNRELGFLRAQTVTDWFIDQGFDNIRFFPISMGEKEPFAWGHDEFHYGLNRRVEMVIK